MILASLEAIAEDGPDAKELREALRARAVDPDHRYETVLGTLGFDANGDSTQQMVSFFRWTLRRLTEQAIGLSSSSRTSAHRSSPLRAGDKR